MSEKLDLEPLAKSLLDNKFVGVLLLSDNKIEVANNVSEGLFGLNQDQIGWVEATYLTVYPRIISLADLGLPSRLPFGSF